MIEFYISCKLKEGGAKQPSLIANAIRKCLFDNQMITSGRQFYIYVNAERYNFQSCNTATVLQFLCKIDRTTDLTLDELNVLLEPAFKILSEKNGLDNFEISKS
ncbi:hypothetical protein [Propionispira raffinosivorans]|uniref:hypothetical protein n=1 Tax=Propionispira raffinosivorans TaxID=86959 RepID=UPI000371C7B7|nr:hypothetical protein [Propionispira raffinosivorans]